MFFLPQIKIFNDLSTTLNPMVILALMTKRLFNKNSPIRKQPFLLYNRLVSMDLAKPLFFLVLFLTILSVDTCAQEQYIISTEGMISTCSGAFLDSGSQSSGYQPGENYTITFCPLNEGDVVYIEFLSVDINCPSDNNCDQLMVYDGDNTGAPQMGAVTGPVTYTASPLNTTGCLTFQFTSNGSGEGAGWSATITCDTPCDRPEAYAVTSPGGDMPIKVCIGEEITFDGTSSTVADGQVISEWLWDFRDGTTDTSGPLVSHSYSEPGEYIVQLYLVDDNECASTNRTDIQIWVSTEPNWMMDFPLGLSTCLGDTLCLNLDIDTIGVTWDAQPTTDLGGGIAVPDIVGECFESTVEFNSFAPGQTLNNIDDLLNIYVNFEHSFMGDLLIQIICPDGTTVNLHEQGGGGCDLGEAIQATDGVPGVGWDYWWAPDAPNGIWADEGSGNSVLPSGVYSSVGNLEDLVGCPLNGVWSLSICDLWGADDGTVFEWAVNFNPDIYPELTQFTPSYGLDSDSSFWSGPFIVSQDLGLDSICIVPDQIGTIDYTATVTNDFGCSWDSTVTVSIYQAQEAYAGEDLIFCGTDDQLQGGLNNVSGGSCNEDGGDYTYCYGNNENTSFTYCPDELDGTTMMTIEFFAGQVENFFDHIIIHDGSSVSSPILADLSGASMAGQIFTATQNGCLTIQITSDGSVSCGSGSYDPLQYSVTCGVASDYVFNWSPPENVSDPTIPNPNVLQLSLDNQFILEAYPEGHLACATQDTVNVLPAFAFTVDFTAPTCLGNNGSIGIDIDPVNSTPPWYLDLTQAGDTLASITSINGGLEVFENLVPGQYTVTIGNGQCAYSYPIEMPEVEPSTIQTVADSTICIGGTAYLAAWSDQDPENNWQYIWDHNLGTGAIVSDNPLEPTTYTVYAIDSDNCETEPVVTNVSIYSPLTLEISSDTMICKNGTVSAEVLTTSGGYGVYSYDWEYDGMNVASGSSINYLPNAPGSLCAIVSDQCETPTNTACLEVDIEQLPVLLGSDKTSGCAPLEVEFKILTDTSLFNHSYWELGDGFIAADKDILTHEYPNPGSYSIDLSLTSERECVYNGEFPNYIQVHENPVANFYATPQPTKIPNTEITFHDNSIGDISSYYWVIDTENQNAITYEESPVFEFPYDIGGEYDVSLTVTNSDGCQNEYIKTIYIDEILNIYVPTAFSPNGDGINDYFYVTGTDIDPKRYHFELFNRWGAKIYETHDINDIWVGERQNGQYYYVQNETYVWRIVAYSASTNERVELTGNLTVVR